jgi:hypothetical protein
VTVIPDSIEPVIGWRGWALSDNGLLLSQHNHMQWTPGERAEAKCSPSLGGTMPWMMPPRYKWEATKGAKQTREQAQKYVEGWRKQYAGVSHAPHIPDAPVIELPYGWGWVCTVVESAGSKPHEAPGEHCTCGIYAVSDLNSALSGDIIGRIALWGKVVPGTHGWRGQYAYPVELFARAVKKRFGKTKVSLPDSLLAYQVPLHGLSDVQVEMAVL